jgi:5-formyltetrahydrofolate cyclo-ligase
VANNVATRGTRQQTRRQLRDQRRTLAAELRHAAEQQIVNNVRQLSAYRRAERIAVYFGIDGEVDVTALIVESRSRGKLTFAPVLTGDRLDFVELGAPGEMTLNRYGIVEPVFGRRVDPRTLDIVLTPLVGFDGTGTRLGMGKAFYDRSFAFLRLRQHWIRPKLIGIAFALQEIEHIEPQPWDVSLWGAVTEADIHYF